MQTEVSRLGFVHKHCCKPAFVQPKAVGFAPGWLRTQLCLSSYILWEPFWEMKDCRCKSASLLLRNRVQLGGQDGGKQMLDLCSTCLSDDGGELSTGSARSAHVCCSADQRLDSYINGFCFPRVMQVHLKFQAFPCEAVTSSDGVWMGAAGCWQLSWLLMATARACRFWE